MCNINNKNQKGVSLYFAIVILSVLAATLLALIAISISQIKVITSLGNSVIAFYAADSGIERVLYHLLKEGWSPSPGECPFVPPEWEGLSNEAEYKVCVSEDATSTIWSIGRHKKSGIKRKIEINF